VRTGSVRLDSLSLLAQAKQAAALQDVDTELERLRVKAAAKARSSLPGRRRAGLTTLRSPAGPRVPAAALLRPAQAENQHPGTQPGAPSCAVLIPSLTPVPSQRTTAQILQQNVLLKFKYFVKFLQQHSPEVFPEVRQAYVETLSRIYRSALCALPPQPM